MLPVVLNKDDCEMNLIVANHSPNQMLGVEIALADVDRASCWLTGVAGPCGSTT